MELSLELMFNFNDCGFKGKLIAVIYDIFVT